MIYIIIVSAFILYTYGIYRVFMFLFRLPSLKTYMVAGRLSKMGDKTSILDIFIKTLTVFVGKRLNIPEERLIKIKTYLRYYDVDITAKDFVANQITKTSVLCIIALLLYFIFPILSMGMFFASLIYYFKCSSDLETNYKLKRGEIEGELPRFCATVTQEIKNTRDIVSIIERYIETSNKTLKKELEIVLADMKSSNYEAALVRFESRLSIGAVSDIVRGLIGVIRGDDMRNYFEMLSHDLDVMELQNLEDRAAKQPDKIKKYQFFILAAMMLMYFVTIAVYLLQINKPAYL